MSAPAFPRILVQHLADDEIPIDDLATEDAAAIRDGHKHAYVIGIIMPGTEGPAEMSHPDACYVGPVNIAGTYASPENIPEPLHLYAADEWTDAISPANREYIHVENGLRFAVRTMDTDTDGFKTGHVYAERRHGPDAYGPLLLYPLWHFRPEEV